jgi:hypothetical protein
MRDRRYLSEILSNDILLEILGNHPNKKIKILGVYEK